MPGMPTMLTNEKDAITVANILPCSAAGAALSSRPIPTPIVVPPNSPANSRSASSQ